MRKLRIVLFAALTCCSKSVPAPAPEPAPAVTASPVAPAADAPRPPSDDDDAPRLSLAPARVGFKDSPAQTVSATATLHDRDAVYVAVPVDVEDMSDATRIDIVGSRYGLGVVDLASQRLIMRFSGKDAPPAFDVQWQAAHGDQRWGFTGVLHVTIPAKVPPRKTLRTELCTALASSFRAVTSNVHDADSFYTFAAERLSLSTPGQRRRSEERFTAIDDAMAIYTGASSLHDALQTDRALRVARGGKRTIPVASLKPIEATPHPWDKLMRELGSKPVIEPLARAVPAGMLYVHAKGARALSTTVQRLTEQFSGIMRAADVDTGAGDVTETYATQLALEHSPATAAAADAAIDGIAIVSSDPFFREGTDVTVAFHVTSAQVLKVGLDAKERALADKLGAVRSTYAIGSHEVALTATADGRMNRHQLTLGDVVLVSNSRAALERFVAVQQGKAPSLASQGDFTYMRTLYPYGPDQEDTFVFAGDAFIAHVVSPAFKVASARRVNAVADVQAVSYAAMLYAWLEGRAPTSADELLKSKLVTRPELSHPGGEPITFDPVRGAGSKLLAGLIARPLIEQPVDKISAEERGAYDRFREEYDWRWRKYVDPVAVRIVNGEQGIALDGRLMPLSNRREYQDIESLAGVARVTAPNVRDGVMWSSAVGPDAPLRHDLESTGKSFLGTGFQLGWLGVWVMAGSADRGGLYDLAVASGELGKAQELEGTDRGLLPPLWRVALHHAPIYVGAEIRSTAAFAAVLTGLRRQVEEAAPGLVEWTNDEPIDGQPVSVIREVTSDPSRIGIYYAIANGAFVASLDRATLATQLAAIRDGRGPKGAASETGNGPSTTPITTSAQSTLDYAPKPGGWLAKIVTAFAEKVATAQAARRASAEAAVRPYLRGFTDDGLASQAARNLLGYLPAAPDAVSNVASLGSVKLRVSIEGAEEHRGLHVGVKLGR